MPAPDLRSIPVAVTGGAGFIGAHLVEELVVRGAKVTVLDDLSTGYQRNLDSVMADVRWLRGDIRHSADCAAAVAGARYVFHQAAVGSVPRSLADPATTIDVNVGGTARLFAACRGAGIERIVYASSSSVYGDHPALPKREGREGRPLSPYALSKQMGEQMAGVFSRCFGMQLIGLRYFNVYGPRQDPNGPYAAVVPRFVAALRSGVPPVIDGDGEQSRDFTFVADAVAANLLAAGAPPESCGRAYNVGRGERTTVNQLAAAVRAACGGGPAPVHSAPRPGDVPHSLADTLAAREFLGFTAATPLDEGIRRLVTAG
jgi:nucleoside-diphosphate-sugar epimerase